MHQLAEFWAQIEVDEVLTRLILSHSDDKIFSGIGTMKEIWHFRLFLWGKNSIAGLLPFRRALVTLRFKNDASRVDALRHTPWPDAENRAACRPVSC